MNSSIQNNYIHTVIFNYNDIHGKTSSMEKIATASSEFDLKYYNRKDVDTLKLTSGDILIGEDEKINNSAIKFQNFIKTTSSSPGNHEFDLQDKIKNFLPSIKFDFLSCNVKVKEGSPWHGKIIKSKIEEHNGHKYGLIGTSPIDLHKRTKEGSIREEISVDGIQDTIVDIQREVDKLEKQGVSKIILISHLGYDLDKMVATNTHGVDVIIGGHSHDLIFDVVENENLLYSKTGEPVVITQQGRDGKNFGILDLEFDQNGIIRKVQNNVGFTKDFRRHPILKFWFDKMLGGKEVYGTVAKTAPPLTHDLIEPNPHAYFVLDCMRKDLDADVALLSSSYIRGYFEEGNIDTRILNDILPFKNKIYEVNYSEKDLVEAVKKGAKSFVHTANKPGIFYASGIKYSVTPTGKLLSMSYVHRNGQETPIDIEHPREDKFYRTAINDFCAEGNDGFTMLNKPANIIKKHSYDPTECVKNVLNKTISPINIFDDGRIKIINTSN